MAERSRDPPLAAIRGWFGTVRVRTTVAAVVVVGLSLVGALVMVAVLRHFLTREVETAALLRGRDVAMVLGSGSIDRDTPRPGGGRQR